MKKRSKFAQNFFAIILAACIPLLLALASLETKRYATLKNEVSELENKQYQLIEDNKKLVSEIGMLSSSERIESIAVSEYGMRLAESEEIVRVEIKGSN